MTKESGLELIDKVLGKKYFSFDLPSAQVKFSETFAEEKSEILLKISGGYESTKKQYEINGSGNGLVDALFSALIGYFSNKYKSLEGIQLISFETKAKLNTKHKPVGSDALVKIEIGIKNSRGYNYYFSTSSRSLAQAAVGVVLKMFEFFINAEKAYIVIYKSLHDAKERNRQDLVTRYTSELSDIVKCTGYETIVEKLG